MSAFKTVSVLFCAMTIVSGASASLLWDQSPTSADGFYTDGISTNGSQAYGQSVADDFTLSTDSNITSFVFWGSSENFANADLSNFASWDILVMDSAFNVVDSTNLTAAQMNATATGNQNAGGGNEYRFEVSAGGTLTAGTYWFGVGSVNVDPQGDAFVWSSDTNADSTSAANFFNGNGWFTFDNAGSAPAFQVNGDPVPEPASMVLLGLGAAAMIRRRRKN